MSNTMGGEFSCEMVQMVCHLTCICYWSEFSPSFGSAFQLAFALRGSFFRIDINYVASVSRVPLVPVFGFSTDFLVLLWSSDLRRHLLGFIAFHCYLLLMSILFFWDSPVRILTNNCEICLCSTFSKIYYYFTHLNDKLPQADHRPVDVDVVALIGDVVLSSRPAVSISQSSRLCASGVELMRAPVQQKEVLGLCLQACA